MVVSNTSPISNLAVIGYLHLLRELYGSVEIPQAVREELAAVDPIAVAIASEDWIQTRSVRDRRLVQSLLRQLHSGEAEAIALALEEDAQILLVDEHRARQVALRLGLRPMGVLGVLLDAKTRNVIHSVRPLLDALMVKAGFWVDSSLYDRVLAAADEA